MEGGLALYDSYMMTFDLPVNVTAGVYTIVVRVNDDPDVRTLESYLGDNTYDVGYWTAQVRTPIRCVCVCVCVCVCECVCVYMTT
jgi:hypothetical protein